MFCGYSIPKGNKYDSSTMIHDGELYTWKAHQSCSQLALALDMYDMCDEGVTGDGFVFDENSVTVMEPKNGPGVANAIASYI